jgi:hypothetical protein
VSGRREFWLARRGNLADFDNSLVRFFKGGDEDDLARSMLDFIQHPEKRRSLVENASEFIDKNDWNVNREGYLERVARLTNPQPVVDAP